MLDILNTMMHCAIYSHPGIYKKRKKKKKEEEEEEERRRNAFSAYSVLRYVGGLSDFLSVLGRVGLVYLSLAFCLAWHTRDKWINLPQL